MFRRAFYFTVLCSLASAHQIDSQRPAAGAHTFADLEHAMRTICYGFANEEKAAEVKQQLKQQLYLYLDRQSLKNPQTKELAKKIVGDLRGISELLKRLEKRTGQLEWMLTKLIESNFSPAMIQQIQSGLFANPKGLYFESSSDLLSFNAKYKSIENRSEDAATLMILGLHAIKVKEAI